MDTVFPHAAAARGDERRRPWSAAVVVPLAVVGVLATLPLVGFVVDGTEAFDGFVARLHLYSYVVAVSFAVTGALIARHQPGNALAPLATGIGVAFGVSMVLDRYAFLGFAQGWPGVEWALWAAQWSFVPGLWAVPTLLVLHFPSGQVPSARWQAVAWVAAAGVALGTTGWALAPYGTVDTAPALPLDNPVATDAGIVVFAIGAAIWSLTAVASLVGLTRRVAASRGAERAQLLWLLVGLAATMASVAVGGALGEEAIPSVGVVLLPAAIAVGVVRHGLWDVRVVVQRSLVSALLLAAIFGVYVATVAVLGDTLGETIGAPLVATALVAAGVQPLRERLQRVASRLLYGDREDPYAALSRLGSQLDAVADRGSLLVAVAEALVRTMRLEGAEIVEGDTVVASVGTVTVEAAAVPLVVAGEHVGTLRIGVRPGDSLVAADQDLLRGLARHVAAAVRADRLEAELAASRARLVTAREEERRRIRRDLHDELGPTLAAIANEAERSGLDDLAVRVRSTVRAVRALVDDLRPLPLDQLGLEGGVRELCRSLSSGALSVECDVRGDLSDLPAAVDVAAYRIVGEALTNTVRHASASSATVRLRRSSGALEVVVADDGRGTGGAPAGVGRRSMQERADELGGTLTMEDGAGDASGTVVRAVLPLPPGADPAASPAARVAG